MSFYSFLENYQFSLILVAYGFFIFYFSGFILVSFGFFKFIQLLYLTAYKVHVFLLKISFKIPCVLYAICRFKIHDSWSKLVTWQLLLA